MNRLAGLLGDQQQFDKGIIILEQPHHTFPAAVSTLGHLSDGYLEMKNYPKSKASYLKLIELLKKKDIFDRSWKKYIAEQMEKIASNQVY